MKYVYITLILLVFLAPVSIFGQESLVTDRLQMTIEDNGNWQLTDLQVNITWRGEWIAERLMKVTGSDNSCFIMSEDQEGLMKLDCQNLEKIDTFLSY